jgi:metallophosphoesterase (TIGR00282 family)
VLPGLRDERGIDFVTANGENVAGGMGLTPSTADAILAAGVDVITSGNHIWDKREIYPYLESNDRVLRPHNYGTHEVPGRGWGVFHALDGSDLAVINLQGRTYMQPIENPFTDADALLDEASEPLPPIRLVDFHCELTSEKNALGLYLDGRASVVAGTHTHVVTGDERILPGGTAYLTDLGLTGPVWSVIGFDPKTVLPRFLNALPTRFEVGEGTVVLNALQVDVDPATGRALQVERIQQLVEL